MTTPSLASRSRRTPRARRSYEIDDLYEMMYNLFVQPGYKPSGRRAQNVNTVDEVPDSSWFTNRIGTDRSRTTNSSAVLSSAPRPIPRAGSSSGKRPPAFIRA